MGLLSKFFSLSQGSQGKRRGREDDYQRLGEDDLERKHSEGEDVEVRLATITNQSDVMAVADLLREGVIVIALIDSDHGVVERYVEELASEVDKCNGQIVKFEGEDRYVAVPDGVTLEYQE